MLTDGANTYSVPNSDPAGNKSTYAAYGYTGQGYNGTGTTRMFMGTSGAIGQYDYSGTNYTNALNEHMTKLCDNAKAGNIIMMTVSLDLSTNDTEENKAIEALKKCSSDSRFRKDPTNRQAGEALLERHRRQPCRNIQGNRRRTVEPAHRGLIAHATSGAIVPPACPSTMKRRRPHSPGVAWLRESLCLNSPIFSPSAWWRWAWC